MSNDSLDNGPAILAATWVFTALSIIVICLRFYVRMEVAHMQGLKAHDWVMSIALVFLFTLLHIPRCYLMNRNHKSRTNV